jgi:hypothetical protein
VIRAGVIAPYLQEVAMSDQTAHDHASAPATQPLPTRICRTCRCTQPALADADCCAEHVATPGKRSLREKWRCAQPDCRRYIAQGQTWCGRHRVESIRLSSKHHERRPRCSTEGCRHFCLRGESFCRYHLREIREASSATNRKHGLHSRFYTEAEVRLMMEDQGIAPLEQEVRRLRVQLMRALAALDTAIASGRGCSDGVNYLQVAGRTVGQLHKLLLTLQTLPQDDGK